MKNKNLLRKKILLIHHRLPYPPHSGMDKARYSLLVLLHQYYHVTLMVLNTNNLKESDLKAVSNYCQKLIIVDDTEKRFIKISFFKKLRTLSLLFRSIVFKQPTLVSSNYSSKFKLAIKKLIQNDRFDIIQPLSDYTMDYVADIKTDAYKLFGPNDDMVGMTQSIIDVSDKLFSKVLLKIEKGARKNWQKKMIEAADKICYFSMSDIKSIIDRDPINHKEKLVWMPAIIEHETSWNEKAIYQVEANTLIFTGGLVSGFNRLSLIYFLKNIWPEIVKRKSDIKLYVVGQNSDDYFKKQFGFPNVVYTGRVENMTPWLEKAAVFISPVNCGTGVKTKIIEALRFGKPIVSTSLGVGGIWEKPSDSIIITDDPIDFAKNTVNLLTDENYRIQTALNARNLFESTYTSEKVFPMVRKIYENLLP